MSKVTIFFQPSNFFLSFTFNFNIFFYVSACFSVITLFVLILRRRFLVAEVN